MSKQKPVHETLSNPWLAGRREWNERYGSEVKKAEVFGRIALLAAFGALLAVGGLLWSLKQVADVPTRTVVVEVDALTGRIFQRPALNDGDARDVRVKAGIATYVERLRTVSIDPRVMKANLARVQAMSSTDVNRTIAQKLAATDENSPENPFVAARSRTVQVEVVQVLAKAERDSWEVVWTETARALTGEEIERLTYRGNLTVALQDVKNLEQARANENGLVVLRLDWSRINKL